MKKRRLCIAATAICLLLSGCTSLSLSSPDILTPPKAEGNQAEIQELILNSADSSHYEMVYPRQGDYKSSVIFVNLDGDSDDEAIAMFTCDKEAVKVLVADKEKEKYVSLTECTVYAPMLDQVEIADFGGDEKAILLSYPGSSPTLESLTVISPGDGVQHDLINTCAAHVVGDYDGDQTDDLLTLALADGENLPTARLFTGSDGAITEQSSCEISSDTKDYVGLSFGKICNEISGAVIDAVNTDGRYSTQLICYDYNVRSIINPLYVNDGYDRTKRTAKVTSADIDRDGVIEIPLCAPMAYSQNEDDSTVCDRIDWSVYEYAQASFSTKQSAVLCDKLGFLLNLSTERADIVTARYTGENAMSVFLWEYKRGAPERTTKLLTVRRYDKAAYNSGKIIEAAAAENNTYIYTYVIDSEDDYYTFTDDEVKNSIVLFEEPSDGDPLK